MSCPFDKKMCRLCMDKNSLLVDLHPKHGGNIKHSPGNILEVIEQFTTIKVHPLDNLPQKICEGCILQINSMLAYRNKCKRNNEKLHQMMGQLDGAPKNVIEISDDEAKMSAVNVKSEPGDEDDFTFGREVTTETQDSGSDDDCSVADSSDVKAKDEIDFTFVTTNAQETQDSGSGHDKGTECLASKRPPPVKIACDICGKLYIIHRMKYHLNEHNGLKPYECDEPNCTSKFAGPHYLTKHKRFCHRLKPRFFCDVCGTGFKTKINLDMHRSYHFDPNLPCEICGKLFRNKRALRKHKLVHSQERKFKCETCGKSYQTRYTLRIHKRVHTQEKPYSCHCGVSFAYKCLLKSHTEKHHK